MKNKQFQKDYSMAVKACEVLDDNKAEDVSLIDVSYMSNLADYFIIATANSTVHNKALVDKIEQAIEEMGQKVIRRDGLSEGRWTVLDYGNLIIHVFTQELREFYHLEKIWNDGKNVLNMQGVVKLKEQSIKDNQEDVQKDN